MNRYKSPINEFFKLCEQGKIYEVKQIVELLPSFLYIIRDSGEKCAFYYAVKGKQWELCDWMIEQGAKSCLPYYQVGDWNPKYYEIPEADEKYLRYLFKDSNRCHITDPGEQIDSKYLLLFPQRFIVEYLNWNEVKDFDYHEVATFEYKIELDQLWDSTTKTFKNNMKTIDPRIVKKICQNMTGVPDEILNRFPTGIKSAS